MIQINDTQIEFTYMGLFTTDEDWIHPQSCESTYEIIYVTNGDVFLAENDTFYDLKKGDIIVLRPGEIHRGYKKSFGKTSFYWIHFKMNKMTKTTVKTDFSNVSVIKELMHYSHNPNSEQYVKDSLLMHLLSVLSVDIKQDKSSSLAADIFEWTRINAASGLSVQTVADHFGYNCEYVSKLIKREYGITLKKLIDRYIIEKAKNYLNNTSYSIKEISNILGFSSPNTFINFFKYHEEISPSKYKNSYSYTHMNKK